MKVKPVRDADNREQYRRLWWQFAEKRRALTAMLERLPAVFVAVAPAKYLAFTKFHTRGVFAQSLKVFTTDRWDLFSVVQSNLHEVWARKYSGALETRLRYSPSDCFETFAFPEGLWSTPHQSLAATGEGYHEHRKAQMLSLWLGLTDIYNLFHERSLSPEKVAKVSKKPSDVAQQGYHGIVELRRLQCELDIAVRDAYGWTDLDLGHGFHEVETLPENDRVRYTISAAARKEILRRLLALNQVRAEAEADAAPKKPNRLKKAELGEATMLEMFPSE